MNISIKISLTLLKLKALKLDFNVPRRLCQKLIKKKEVKPIISQPKNKVNKLLAKTNNIILSINQFSNSINKSSLASYLK